MHMVISMNLQWKIIFSTCLVIAICFTTASAATEFSFTKNSFDKSSTTSFAEAKAAAAANFRTDWTSFDREPPDAGGPADPIPPEITRPTVIPTRVPTPQVTLPAAFQIPTITRLEAEEIALAQVPHIRPTSRVHVVLEKNNCRAPSKLIWSVFFEGVSTECGEPGDPDYNSCVSRIYVVAIHIDAMTGAILWWY
jgi:hypothetical protein